ncbi:MAG: hypothetical protein V1766_01155 [Pseudomonadota bacterium]
MGYIDGVKGFHKKLYADGKQAPDLYEASLFQTGDGSNRAGV